jgi:hypothetical protein
MPRPEIRVSDAERNLVVDQLNNAVGEGRLTLVEFEDRLRGVLAARTREDMVPFTADLPVTAAPEEITLRSRASSLRRTGRWVVPRRLAVEVQSSSVRLDLTEAQVASPTVAVTVDARTSSVTLVLPPGASAEAHDFELSHSTVKSSVPDSGGLHVVVGGELRASSLKVRYQRRFLWWRW